MAVQSQRQYCLVHQFRCAWCGNRPTRNRAASPASAATSCWKQPRTTILRSQSAAIGRGDAIISSYSIIYTEKNVFGSRIATEHIFFFIFAFKCVVTKETTLHAALTILQPHERLHTLSAHCRKPFSLSALAVFDRCIWRLPLGARASQTAAASPVLNRGGSQCCIIDVGL
eukprot:SAG31_NODE_65_length_28565_cov_8.402914_32_plen_171_part_00